MYKKLRFKKQKGGRGNLVVGGKQTARKGLLMKRD